MNEYCVPAGPGEAELVEKRSRFLGHLRPVESEEEARAFIAEMKKKYYDARHNCWCYSIRDGAERYSDDGEPQGSAGIPMLEVLRRRGVTNAVCVVTRYFGGVLLGAGGLVRAYTKGCAIALDAAQVVRMQLSRRLLLDVPYPLWDKVSYAMKSLPLLIEDTSFGASVEATVLIRVNDLEEVTAKLMLI